ncbi:uncharacterized protein EI90DRAFT_2836710, partial [Cantharellus anzutake]|uniref:uncharacterized protein n=1 Tax=Cantharellus anzutake TaxID=1750568 RepID=UPI001903300B
VKIAGKKAYVLFNSRTKTDTILPDFVHAVHIPILQLENPVVLQMGMKGTRSLSCLEQTWKLKSMTTCKNSYFDVINIDRYNAIFGAPWLNKNQVNV